MICNVGFRHNAKFRENRILPHCTNIEFRHVAMLKVWGGGIYPLDEWFDACDKHGTVRVFGRNLHSRMPLVPTPALLEALPCV
jgi:hypothetical protein